MVLTEQDIRDITRAVLSEVRHRLDRRLKPLVEKIISLVQNGGGILHADDVNALNPYYSINFDLPVVVRKMQDAEAGYDSDANVFIVDPRLLKSKRCFSVIMHEVSHFIDLGKRTKEPTDDLSNSIPLLNNCTYLFKPTEIQARLAQYAELIAESLWHRKLKITDSRTYLGIDIMEKYLNMLKKARYNPIFPSNAMLLLTWVLMSESAQRLMRRKETHDFNDVKHLLAYIKGLSFDDFIKGKDAVIRRYEKRLRDMKHKALKIKYDAIMENQ